MEGEQCVAGEPPGEASGIIREAGGRLLRVQNPPAPLSWRQTRRSNPLGTGSAAGTGPRGRTCTVREESPRQKNPELPSFRRVLQKERYKE